MEIKFDDKEILREINCLKIEYNSKPDLILKVVNNENTLILVVDMINGFCKKGALSSPRCNAVIPGLKKFLELTPLAKRIFVRDCHSEDSQEFKWFPPHCHNTAESGIVSELSDFSGADLPKNSTNGFYSLIKKIPDLNFYSNIVLCGVCTDICIMQLGLSLRSYLSEINSSSNVVVFTDLIDTYDASLHNADLMNMFALKLMSDAGVQIFKNVI